MAFTTFLEISETATIGISKASCNTGCDFTREWGMRFPDWLQISHTDYFEENKEDQELQETQFCAEGLSFGKDSCNGDSGGPLMSLNSDYQWVANGVVSSGTYSCDSVIPGVYTRVSKYVGWIKSVIKEEEADKNIITEEEIADYVLKKKKKMPMS